MRLGSLCYHLRPLAVLFVLLPSGATLYGQSIRIKLIDGRNGRPMAHACVNVGADHLIHMLAIPTDENGIAQLRLTHNDAEMDIQSHWTRCGDWGVINPVVKYSDAIGIQVGYVLCQARRADYSWLAVQKFPTADVLQHGIVTGNTCGKATESPTPGEVIFFVRPLTWWERQKA